MTPTRLQLNHMVHGVVSGPRAMFTAERGDTFARARLEGLEGWLITDERGKSVWVPLSAVSGVDVSSEQPKAPYLAQNDPELRANLDAAPPGEGFEAWMPEPAATPAKPTCPECGKVCGHASALKMHMRHKHGAP